MKNGFRLRSIGMTLMFAAFVAGLAVGGAWFYSSQAWQSYLTRSYVTGISVHEALRMGTPMPNGVTATALESDQAGLADAGAFSRLPGLPTPSYVTNVSILTDVSHPVSGPILTLGIVSDKLPYSVSELVSEKGASAAEKFGNVTRLLATYCSAPMIFANLGDGTWWRIDGASIWGCAAVPTDLRLPAALLALALLAALATWLIDVSAHFDRFSRALRGRRRLGGPESYTTRGPAELREIVAAVNAYLESERAQLSKRAMVLSGVSHDLGTPATRLRLRSALIEDKDLRQKLESDIDSMTGMIESVLTYTRAELSSEAPRKVSLTSLVEALVDDYCDMGKPVALRAAPQQLVEGGRVLFTGQSGHGALPEQQRILVTARIISLQRAVSNLIDNALKYGRRAVVELTANADHALIVVEDEGSGMSAQAINDVIAPFKRGDNTSTIDGFGLGLTIVATVAEQHGGRLYFETGAHGLRACLEIQRN